MELREQPGVLVLGPGPPQAAAERLHAERLGERERVDGLDLLAVHVSGSNGPLSLFCLVSVFLSCFCIDN